MFAVLILLSAAFAAFNLIARLIEAQRRELGVGMALGSRLSTPAAHAPARGAIGERPVHSDPAELTVGVLVQTAHPGVADLLPAHGSPDREVSGWTRDPRTQVSIKLQYRPNLTAWPPGPDVGLGYTPTGRLQGFSARSCSIAIRGP